MYMKMEKQMFDKQKLGPEETTGHREDSDLQGLSVSPTTLSPSSLQTSPAILLVIFKD